MSSRFDAVVVGAGPNGLAAAITLARAGQRVLVLERMAVPGGGMRSAELTLPGFVHDVCSAVHPLALSSPFFRTLPLDQHGLEWLHSPAALAHPLDDGTAAVLERSIEATGATLDRGDGIRWRELFGPVAERWGELAPAVLSPLRFPSNPLLMAGFGMRAIRSAAGLARGWFHGERARALFAGNAAHAMVPLTHPPTAAFGLTLVAAAHAVGWPIARGGSQSIANAMVSYLRSLGGEVETGVLVRSVDELPPARTVLLDVTPRQALALAGHRFPDRYRQALERFRYGAGSFKMDWALDGPIPWTAPECGRAATVHLGGTLDELVASEHAPLSGVDPERPFVLLAQPTLFDPSRAPAGKQIAWAYCHVPRGSTRDLTVQVEAQIERFAPGFRDRILARSVMGPAALERHNPNLVGGDISAGAMTLRQTFFRPVASPVPYRTPARGIYLCSASTPPGGAVHGMCGYFAALAALGRPLRPPRSDAGSSTGFTAPV